MSKSHACSGKCKKFRVTEIYGTGGYDAGQRRCQICNIWVDYRGAHTKNGDPVTDSSDGWICNCCNYRICRNPRNIEYGVKMRRANLRKGYELSETGSHNTPQKKWKDNTKSDTTTETVDGLRDAIMNRLKSEPNMLHLFANVDQHISKLSTDQIRLLLSFMEN